MFAIVEKKNEWKVRRVKDRCNTVAEVVHSRMPEQNVKAQRYNNPASPGQEPSHPTPSQSLQPMINTSTPKAAGKAIHHLLGKVLSSREQSETEAVNRIPSCSQVRWTRSLCLSLTVPLPPLSPSSIRSRHWYTRLWWAASVSTS